MKVGEILKQREADLRATRAAFRGLSTRQLVELNCIEPQTDLGKAALAAFEYRRHRALVWHNIIQSVLAGVVAAAAIVQAWTVFGQGLQ